MKSTSILLLSLLLQSVAAPAPQAAKPVDGIAGVVAKGETVQLVKEGFAFTDGPVPTADGGIYFSDLLTSDRSTGWRPPARSRCSENTRMGPMASRSTATATCSPRKAAASG